MTRYVVHLRVEVTDSRHGEGYEWDAVARRLVNRLRLSARRPLDRQARLRIQHVAIDQAEEQTT